MKRQSKKGSRGTGEPVVYDPEALREFVTGFRKRKQARRLEAQANNKKLAKEERRQLRQEKRDFIREQRERIALADAGSSGEGDDGSDDDVDEQDPNATIQRFENPDGAVVTAVVAPLDAPFPLVSNTHQSAENNDPSGNVEDDKSQPVQAEVTGNSVTDRKPGISSTFQIVSKKAGLKVSAPVRKPKWHRKHISYTHTYHKRRAKDKGRGRSTHSERRKRQGKGGSG